jgi:hypothetical protein
MNKGGKTELNAAPDHEEEGALTDNKPRLAEYRRLPASAICTSIGYSEDFTRYFET